MPLKIVRNDITKMQVDAIVNTANEAPIYSDGTDRAVYKAAGEEALLKERSKIGYLEEGDAAITPGFNLPAKYIIHAVSPYYEGGQNGEEEKLRSCYKKSLALALENGCKSIAFPLIATGGFGYPKEEGLRIAVDEINAFLLKHSMLIYLVVFDEKATRLAKNLYSDLESYIDENYVNLQEEVEYGGNFCTRSLEPKMDLWQILKNKACVSRSVEATGEADVWEADEFYEESCEESYEDSYEDFYEENESALKERMQHMSDTFQEYLLYLIKEKGMANSEVYRRAIITKQLFSKIKLNAKYHPDKGTAMRLCVGAKLNLDETKDLLARAGYALSPCDKRDIIFSFFIEHEVYDMIEIDIALEEHGLPCFIE